MQRLHAAKSFTLSSRLPVPSFSVSACHVTVISDLQSDPGLWPWLAPDLAMGTGPRADVNRTSPTDWRRGRRRACLLTRWQFISFPSGVLPQLARGAYCSGNEPRLCASKYSK